MQPANDLCVNGAECVNARRSGWQSYSVNPKEQNYIVWDGKDWRRECAECNRKRTKSALYPGVLTFKEPTF